MKQLKPLTRREIQIARLVSLAFDSQTIAEDLFISKRTVEQHILNVCRKLNVKNRRGIMYFFYKNGSPEVYSFPKTKFINAATTK